MTNEQLSELRKMSAGQIARKYTPLMMKTQITREQYDWLLSQGSSTSPEATESTETNETITDDTTHDDPISGGAQKHKLHKLLIDGGWHSTSEIVEKVYGEGMSLSRVAARVYDLKKDGLKIESRKKNKGVWEYRLSTTSNR